MTLTYSAVTNSMPPYTVAEWQFTGLAPDSTCTVLFELEMPSLAKNDQSYRNYPNGDLTGEALGIQLMSIGCSCLSTDFDVKFLNINDITKINTVHEVLSYEGENQTFWDNDFLNYVIVNRDVTQTNKLYMYFMNKDTVATGTITVQMSYVTIL